MSKLCVFLALTLLATSVVAADSGVGNERDAQEVAPQSVAEFLRFDRELRYAVERNDMARLALLVQFPLRVNFADRSQIMLRDPLTLQKQFARVFTPDLLKAVKAQAFDNLSGSFYNGVSYGNGGIWVNLAGAEEKQFRIVAINVPGNSPTAKAGDVELACSTKQFRIVIDSTADESKARYRAWNLPRGLEEKPDIELVGSRHFEGSGTCGHRVWQFKNANAEYVLSQPGCGQDPPPERALADLQVLLDNRSQFVAWCF